jgi:adenylate cyclase
MAEPRTNRRLAAILAADVVGYSRMMASDEAGTLAALKRHREALFDPAVAEHGGRIVKLMGDGTLVEFGSVVDAVKCALTVQRFAPPAETEAGPRIVLRIGINLGDIIIDGDDIYGDGVNIAARLEPLAEPGGICVAAVVNDNMGSRIDVRFRDAGEVQVKNIERPIRIWKWHPTDTGGAAATPTAPSQTEQATLPSLAVLPFQNMSGDTEQEYFSDGVVEDIITALSRFKSFLVIARNSSFAYKGRAVDVRQVAKELGVHYVLEGSVRRAGKQLRITAQLIDGFSGAHRWAEKFEGVVDDVFDVQDRITESVATIVEPQIRAAELERSRREHPGSVTAYDLYLQALPKHRFGTQAENADAHALLQQAIALDPTNGVLLSQAANTVQHRFVAGWLPLTNDDKALCADLTRRALANSRDDALVLARGGNALIQVVRDYDLGFATVERAVKLNPNDAEVMIIAGIANVQCGSVDQALAHFNRVLRLSPADPYAFVTLTGIAHAQMIRGNYPEALTHAERSLAVNANYDASYWMLIAANAQLGRMNEARAWLARFRALTPDVTIARIKAGQADRDGTRMSSILEGLRLAGLQAG